MEYTVSYNICAIFIYILILIFLVSRKNYASRANAAYLILVVDSLVAAVFDNISVYTITHAARLPLWLNYAVNTIFYFAMNTILLWYCNYLLRVIYKTRPFTRLNRIFLIACGSIDGFFILLNPWTHWIFYFDSNAVYCAGSLKLVVYLVSIAILLQCGYETIRNHESLKIEQIYGMIFVTSASTVSVVFQMFHPTLLITSFSVAMSLIIIYLSIQDVNNSMDPLTRAYNQQAFEDTLNSFVNSKGPFSIITIKLQEFRKVNEMAGVVAGNRILEVTSQRLTDVVSRENLFYNSGTRFTILVHDKGMNEDEILAKVRMELRKGYEIGGMDIHLKPQMIVVHYPDHGSTAFELEDAISYCLQQIEKAASSSDTIYADSLTLEQVRRKAALDHIMQNALHNGNFQVYYQPIRDAATGEYHSAEALLRLHDEEYGFISPEEFIPRAEENGLIIEIGEFVFEEVCRSINQLYFKELGIEYIEINLSAVQCIQKNLKEQLFLIMKRHHVCSGMINLEITETATVSSSQQLLDFMNTMLHDGIKFSLDDYGSGLANINYLLAYPFHIVKLDKYLVWKAFSQDRARVALGHTIEMIKDLKYEIIAEGVETEEQAEGLREMGCDKFQGYLYSKPIPKSDFVAFLKENAGME